jgi:hypothetical protein
LNKRKSSTSNDEPYGGTTEPDDAQRGGRYQ